MPREYRHIEIHEKEIIRIWQEGKTLREIREMLGFSYKQQRDFKTRYNQKQRKIATGITEDDSKSSQVGDESSFAITEGGDDGNN